MNSTPEGGAAGPQFGQNPAGAGQGPQAGETPAGQAGGGQWGGRPSGPGGYPSGAGGYPSGLPGYGGTPVPREVTRVTFRRIVQYIIDSFLAGIIPAIIWFVIGDRGHGATRAIGNTVAVVVWILIMAWYWIFLPYQANGQTFGMRWLGIRVISKDGGPASRWQLFGRWVLLIVDDLVSGLVGLIAILVSRHRQRIGDHVARTLVVQADWQPQPADRPTMAAAQSGARM